MKKIFITAFTFIVSTCLAQFTDVLQIPSSHFKASIKNEYTTLENQLSSTYTDKIGAPQLPTYQKSYALPAGSIVSNISYVTSGKTLLGNNYYLYPSQPACMLNGKPCPDFVAPDAAIYNSATPYPQEIGTVSSDASFFGYHIVKLNICPFEYIPNARQLYYFNQVTINIQYSIGPIEYTARITENRAKITI